MLAYCEHLEVLKADMIKRFTDLLEFEPPQWLIDLFCVDFTTVSLYLREELIDMQSDCEEKARLQCWNMKDFGWQSQDEKISQFMESSKTASSGVPDILSR